MSGTQHGAGFMQRRLRQCHVDSARGSCCMMASCSALQVRKTTENRRFFLRRQRGRFMCQVLMLGLKGGPVGSENRRTLLKLEAVFRQTSV